MPRAVTACGSERGRGRSRRRGGRRRIRSSRRRRRRRRRGGGPRGDSGRGTGRRGSTAGWHSQSQAGRERPKKAIPMTKVRREMATNRTRRGTASPEVGENRGQRMREGRLRRMAKT